MSTPKKDKAAGGRGLVDTHTENTPRGADGNFPRSTNAAQEQAGTPHPVANMPELEKAIWSAPARAGLGYSVQFVLTQERSLDCRWNPHVPQGSDAPLILQMGAYRRARDQFVRDVSKSLGITIFVLEA
jgi:hypothetical protein